MLDWIQNNPTIGAAIIGLVGTLIVTTIKMIKKAPGTPPITINNTNTISQGPPTGVTPNNSQSNVKDLARILFIDDDTTFAVIKILKKAGWRNTKVIRDVTSLDSPDVQEADLFFVDIQGVGKALQFNDEGLGLAAALKKKYPEKKVVIYSAEPFGDRFHPAFRLADDQLPKNAEPYEFQQIVDQFLLRGKNEA